MCQVEHGFVERLARSPRELDDAGIVVNRPRQNREATRGITRPHGGGDSEACCDRDISLFELLFCSGWWELLSCEESQMVCNSLGLTLFVLFSTL